MNFIITPRVINTINALPATDREPISRALGNELFLGQAPESGLTPVQCVIYAMIRQYVSQDTYRASKLAMG